MPDIAAAQLALQPGLGHPQQTADRRADQRDRVHGGHRVIQRCRVQHPLQPDHPGLARRVQRHVEDPPRIIRGGQPSPKVHQHRVREPVPAGAVVATHPGRIAPTGIEREPLHRVPIRQPLQPLQHHHRGHHRRRHRTATPIGEQVGEHLVREQPIPLHMQQPIDRATRQRLIAETRHVVEQVTLPIHQPQRHRPSPDQESQPCNSRPRPPRPPRATPQRKTPTT